jgi:hypothetical protein
MRLVTKDSIEDQTPAHRKEQRPHNRHNPMHAGEVAGPAEPEEGDG